MGIFNSNSKTKDLYDFTRKNLIRRFNYKDSTLEIQIKGVNFAKLNNEEIMLDDVNVNRRVDEIVKALTSSSTKYNPVPKKVIILNEEEEKQENTEETKKENIISVCKPKWNIQDVYIDNKSKQEILTALTISKYKDKLFNEWQLKGNNSNGRAVILNFWGPPGTGKSIMGEAIANYLNKDMLRVNYSELESKYVGETPKNIRRVFQDAKEKDAVIVFDEADSFLGKRLTNVTQSADYGVNITRSVMLIELENFDGVVIFTTNLIRNYDDAFKRRILASIEFKLPDKDGRKIIWKAHISDKLPLETEISGEYLAEKYEGISGADIKDILLYAATLSLQAGRESIVKDDFDNAYDFVISRYKTDNNLEIVHERISEDQYRKETEEIK